MKRKLHSKSKQLLLALLVSALGTGTGCAKKVPYQVTDGQPPQTADEAVTEKIAYYVTEGINDDPRNNPAVSQISVLKAQMPVLKLISLTIGKEYSVIHSCYDEKGKEIFRSIKPYVFVPTSPSYAAWVGFQPNYKTNAAGKWTWVAEVSGLGKFKAHIGVLPPTPDEMAELAQYEKARENVLWAFSQYWLGVDGTFHTVIGYEREITAGERELARRRLELEGKAQELSIKVDTSGPSRRPNGYDLRPGGYRDYHQEWVDELARVKDELQKLPEPQLSQEIKDPYIGYLEIAGVGWTMTKGLCSEADKLNGITFRGEMHVSFRVFRYYRTEGWTDWKDCATLPWFFEAMFGNILANVPSGLEGKLNLSFSIMERDGNWFVTSSLGEKFANGKRVSPEAEWKNVAPLLSYAQDLIRGAKSFTRES